MSKDEKKDKKKEEDNVFKKNIYISNDQKQRRI